MTPISGKMSKRPGQTIKERFASIGKPYFAFLRMDTCILAIVALLSIFINSFILRAADGAGNGVDTALIYNMVTYGSQPFFMVFAVLVVRKVSPGHSQRIGFLFFALLFLFIIITGEKAATDYFIVPALLRSAGAGFYYVTYSFQIIEYTTDENRDAASGISGTISSVIALLFPFLAGLFLSSFEGSFTGYRIFFGFLLGITLLAFIFSLKLTPLSKVIDKCDKKTHLAGAFKGLMKEKAGRSILLMTFFKGVRSGAMAFFIELLIFNAIKDEAVVGLNSTIGKIAAIVGAILYGFIVTPRRRAKSVAVASSLIIAAAVVLFFRADWIFLIIFSVFNSGLNIFITDPELTLYFTVIDSIGELKGKAGEVHTVNEVFLASGEVIGIGLTLAANLLFPGSSVAATAAVILLTGSQFFCAGLISKITKALASDSSSSPSSEA